MGLKSSLYRGSDISNSNDVDDLKKRTMERRVMLNILNFSHVSSFLSENVFFAFDLKVFEVNVEQYIGVDGGVPLGEVEGVAGVEHVDSALDKRHHLQRITASLNDTSSNTFSQV